MLSSGESHEQELLVGIVLAGKVVLDFWEENIIVWVFYLCVEKAELCYTFFFSFVVNKQNCTQETLELSQLVFFPLGNKWATETCPHLGSKPLGEKGALGGSGKCFALALYSTRHNIDQTSVVGMAGIRTDIKGEGVYGCI